MLVQNLSLKAEADIIKKIDLKSKKADENFISLFLPIGELYFLIPNFNKITSNKHHFVNAD